jgi:hypothetical protein
MDVKELVLEKKGSDAPDHIHSREGQLIESWEMGDLVLTKTTMQPGWRWSKDARDEEKTELCEHPHVGYQLSGRQHILMADGGEIDTAPGDFYSVPPGHDAWVVGGEPSVFISISHKECDNPLCRDIAG